MKFRIPTLADRADECDGWTPDLIIRKREAKIVDMPPAEFLRRAHPAFRPRPGRNLKHLIQTVRQGGCFAPLQLWPKRTRSWGTKHEGRHRAWLAMRLRIPTVPVYLWKD